MKHEVPTEDTLFKRKLKCPLYGIFNGSSVGRANNTLLLHQGSRPKKQMLENLPPKLLEDHAGGFECFSQFITDDCASQSQTTILQTSLLWFRNWEPSIHVYTISKWRMSLFDLWNPLSLH